MAKRSVSHRGITPTATADTTNLVDLTYPFVIQGGSSTQENRISEVYMGGQATASAPTYMQLGRDSTVAATAGSNGALDAGLAPATAALALPPLTGNAWTTKPQRSATLGCLLALSFNAFGGLVRWVSPDRVSDVIIIGNTASLGEVSLSAFTGGTPGLISAHAVYEPL